MVFIICDDDDRFAHWAEHVVLEWAAAQNLSVQTEIALNEMEFHRVYHQGVDLVLMDVRLEDASGGDIIEKKRKQWHDFNDVIFMSAFGPADINFYQLLNNAPFGFINKSLDSLETKKTMLECLNMWLKQRHRKPLPMFTYSVNKQVHQVSLEVVLYFEKTLRKITPVTTNGRLESFYMPMKKLIAEVGTEDFIQIAGHLLINRRYITTMNNRCVTLSNGETFAISQYFISKVRNQLFK